MKKAKSSWFAGLDERKAGEVKASLYASEVVMKRLRQMLEKRIEASYQAQRSETNYNDPNWSLKQADYIGSQRAMKEVLDLIDVFD